MQDGYNVPLSRPALLAAALLVGLLSMTALASQRRELTSPQTLPAAIADRTPPSPTEASELRQGRPLDVNRASSDELRLLPGIGPKLALRIVEARTRTHGFSRVADLDAVPGIGPKTLAQLAPLITVGARAQSGNNQPTDSVTAK